MIFDKIALGGHLTFHPNALLLPASLGPASRAFEASEPLSSPWPSSRARFGDQLIPVFFSQFGDDNERSEDGAALKLKLAQSWPPANVLNGFRSAMCFLIPEAAPKAFRYFRLEPVG